MGHRKLRYGGMLSQPRGDPRVGYEGIPVPLSPDIPLLAWPRLRRAPRRPTDRRGRHPIPSSLPTLPSRVLEVLAIAAALAALLAALLLYTAAAVLLDATTMARRRN